jgi:GWxTD domain-containing protein
MTQPADFLAYIAGISLRSLGLVALAGLALRTLRVRSASVKHAVWTMVTIAMLAQAAVSFWLPSIPLRVLSPVATSASRTDSSAIALPPDPLVQQHASDSISWDAIFLCVYAGVALALLGRFFVGYLFTRKLVRSSRPMTLLTASGVAELRESSWVSVPMTIGWLAPKILLPIAWHEWDSVKLRAVLAHEEAHVRRADWVIAIVARLNSCLFWFHPLAWWLERELAVLAEYACDDSALTILPDRQDYARVLLDMAYAAKSANGRLVWGAISMAKPNTVQKRIEQIMDETRQIPKAFGASRWATLAVCSLPLLYLVSSVQLAPAQTPAPQVRRALDSPYNRWLDEEVRWIISDYERVAFTQLRTDSDREKFIEAFWLRRDPTPGTPENEYQEEHYRRIAYANDHFTEAIPGWNTDRGMIYILYGPPDSLDTYGGVPGATYPYETWRYRYIQGMGTDVQLEFVDTTMTGRYHLTRDPSEKQTRR